jgi:hypothetical protein
VGEAAHRIEWEQPCTGMGNERGGHAGMGEESGGRVGECGGLGFGSGGSAVG